MRYHYILHVDDDPDDCELFHEALESFSNARYVAVTNPVKAIRLLESGRLLPDVIVVDLNMPTLNGLEFLCEVKRINHLGQIPVIVFSTCSQTETAQQALQLGAADYMTKPRDFESLQKLLLQKF